MVAGYMGRWVDAVVMRLMDTLLAFPAILIGVALAIMLGPGPVNAALAVGVFNIPIFCRLSRASMLSESQKDYVLAARSVGISDTVIIFKHIMPNCLSPVLVQLALAMAAAIFLESALSFLGLGTRPPNPSWGQMLSTARGYLRQAIWYGIFPGLCLSLLLFGLNFLADAVRDALDPRQIHLV